MLGRDFHGLRYDLFLPFLFLGRFLDWLMGPFLGRPSSIDRHLRRHKILNHTNHQRWVVQMRHDFPVIAKEFVDQCSLVLVQEWNGELAKVTKRPE
jgi:hypothetical protein